MDIVVGVRTNHCIVTLVERVTGATMIGRLRCRKVADVNRRVIEMVQAYRQLFLTITVDNGPEFHGYKEIEQATGVTIYFANPYASWERGTNENTNRLIRQYIPKRTSMKRLTQERCNQIATALNNRPRKRHGFRTPLENSPTTSNPPYYLLTSVLQFKLELKRRGLASRGTVWSITATRHLLEHRIYMFHMALLRTAALVAVTMVANVWIRAAGSGNLWFRPWSTPNALLPFDVSVAGNQTISVESSGLGGDVDVEISDTCEEKVFTTHLSFAGASEQSFQVAFAHAGTYHVLLRGSERLTGRFRIKSSSTHFVVPGLADFDAPFELSYPRAGTYFFYVPPAAESFGFRLWVPDSGESATAVIVAPDGTIRLTRSLNGSDGTWTVAAEPAVRGAFWKVQLSHIGDVRFAVLGIPDWFSESVDGWFEPNAVCTPSPVPVKNTTVVILAVVLVSIALVVLRHPR